MTDIGLLQVLQMGVRAEDEQIFHTIVVMRTNDPDLANRFPHTIFTDNNTLVYTPAQQSGFEYNIELDALKCRWLNSKPLILADFSPIRPVLEPKTLQKYRGFRVVDFSLLGGHKLTFFVRLKPDIFVGVVPLVVIGNTLVLVFRKQDETVIKGREKERQMFKEVGQMRVQKSEGQSFIYSSQFGLLSEQHFMNNFVRGWREYSFYNRLGQGIYAHSMDPPLFHSLSTVFPLPKPKPKL